MGESIFLDGETGDVDMESAEQKIFEFRKLLTGFKLVNIYNMDETAFFYRTVPSRSYEFHVHADYARP